MKLARSQNAVRNMRMGLISKIVNMLLPFLVRAVFIRTLGAEYLGVNGLFSSVLSVLSLAELGFGSAIVFNMYKAIAEDDENTINALLYFYRKVYRCVGAIILGLGLLLIPIRVCPRKSVATITQLGIGKSRCIASSRESVVSFSKDGLPKCSPTDI